MRQAMDHLDLIARLGHLPFELDFLRACGYRFGLDWDGEVQIEPPEFLDVASVTALIERFQPGIETQLGFEGRRARSVCVGGPKNGTPVTGSYWQPTLFHIKRGEWAVYKAKDYIDPRAWFVGKATSKKKARALWFSRWAKDNDE